MSPCVSPKVGCMFVCVVHVQVYRGITHASRSMFAEGGIRTFYKGQCMYVERHLLECGVLLQGTDSQ